MNVTPASLLTTKPVSPVYSKPSHSKSVHFVIKEPPSLSKYGSRVSSAERRDLITADFDCNRFQPLVGELRAEPYMLEPEQIGSFPKDGESVHH